MFTERMTFHAKYGHGDELVALFKEMYPKLSAQQGSSGARLYTDATGPMFSVIMESDFNDVTGYAASVKANAALFADPEFQAWFGRMEKVTDGGETQLFNMERLG